MSSPSHLTFKPSADSAEGFFRCTPSAEPISEEVQEVRISAIPVANGSEAVEADSSNPVDSPPMLLLIAALVGTFTVWYSAGLALVQWRVRSRWDPMFPLSRGKSGALSALWLFHWYLPILTVIAAIDYIIGPGNSGTVMSPRGLPVLALIAALVAGKSHLAARAARLERRLAGDTDPLHASEAAESFCVPFLAPHLSVVFVAMLIFSVLPVNIGFWVLIIYFLISPLDTTSAQARERLLFVFPESPLEAEIRFLLSRHRVGPPVYVQAPKVTRDSFRMGAMVRVEGSLTDFRRCYAVPAVMLHALEPEVYTAWLARELAFDRNRPGFGNRELHAVVSFGCPSVPLAGIAVILAYVIFPGGLGGGAIGLFTACLLSILGFVFLLRMFGLARVARDQYREAYLNWHDADPEAERTVEDFISALYEAEIVVQAIANPEVALHRLRRDPGLMSFLDLCEA